MFVSEPSSIQEMAQHGSWYWRISLSSPGPVVLPGSLAVSCSCSRGNHLHHPLVVASLFPHLADFCLHPIDQLHHLAQFKSHL